MLFFFFYLILNFIWYAIAQYLQFLQKHDELHALTVKSEKQDATYVPILTLSDQKIISKGLYKDLYTLHEGLKPSNIIQEKFTIM